MNAIVFLQKNYDWEGDRLIQHLAIITPITISRSINPKIDREFAKFFAVFFIILFCQIKTQPVDLYQILTKLAKLIKLYESNTFM